MKSIQTLADHIKDEVCDAKTYAENYVEEKVNGNTAFANKYKEMATDELKHAGYLHEMVVSLINKIKSSGIQYPQEMEEKWKSVHAEYVDKAAWVKQMLTL